MNPTEDPSSGRVAQYREAVIAAVMAARLLADHDYPELLRAIEEAHAIGPFLNPTLYRAKSEAMDQDRQIMQAAAAFVKVVMEMATSGEAPALFAALAAARQGDHG